MPFRPPIECPICQDVLAPDRSLEDHFLEGHTQAELARFAAAHHEGRTSGPTATDRSLSTGSEG